ncbi:MAG: SMC-Scp complex subunit ScpB [Parcubacteria group bacterium CG10_big_fil_rev_8_21_14_0_10_36_14]|nr:MAG: SMC-Scp complex subunit ScpB [Parcubacteria group bacterium CG10_big_fil_rev_8_21_14_0_10_36_14]
MNIKSKIESLLFVSGAPFAIHKIVKLLDAKKEDVEKAILELQKEYKDEGRGIQIAVTTDKYQMITSPDNSKLVEEFLNQEVISDLTRPQLEALTIIAYRGPISKTELEQIRGVNCSLILRNLMIRGLIEMETDIGLEKYIITHEFLKFLGVTSVNDLPNYEKLNKDKNLEELLERTEEKNN